MAIIIGYLFFCFFVSLFSKRYPRGSAFYIFLVGSLINGCRSISYTGDNIAYAQYFINNASKSLAESWQGVLSQSGKDPFYYFVGNVFSKIGFSYRGWFIFIAGVYMAGFCYLMYKHSKNYFLSVLFMISLSYYYFSMTGLRQTLALGICFFAFEMAYRRRFIPFVLLVILASMFHSSALIFLVFYFVVRIPIGYRQWGAVLVALITSYAIPNFINRVVSLLAWNEELANYSNVTTGLSSSGMVIQLAVILFTTYFLRMDLKDKQNYGPLLNAMFIGAIIQAYVINIDNIFRMSMYFSVYGSYAVTLAIERQNQNNRRILYVFISILLFVYMLKTGSFKYFSLFGEL